MIWEEHKKELGELYGATFAKDGQAAAILAVAARSAEIAAARGGTMTDLQHAEWRRMAADDVFLAEVDRHVASQGGRIASLESSEKAWRQRVEKAADTLADVAPGELGRLDIVARIERLKAELHHLREDWTTTWKERALHAESRLAAIRERANDSHGLLLAAMDKTTIQGVRAAASWVLEGDAPQEVQDLVETLTITGGMAGEVSKVIHQSTRYPCSPTCTHDDASIPGHPERVRQRSEAFSTATHGDFGGELREEHEEMSRVISEHNRHVDSMGGPVDVPADHDWGENEPDPYTRGAEAMRAACLKAALEWAQKNLGCRPPWLKSAIEGAVP